MAEKALIVYTEVRFFTIFRITSTFIYYGAYTHVDSEIFTTVKVFSHQNFVLTSNYAAALLTNHP